MWGTGGRRRAGHRGGSGSVGWRLHPPFREAPVLVGALVAALAVGILAAIPPTPAEAATLAFTDINPDASDNPGRNSASGGRVNGLASTSGDNQVFYAASEFGGLFKTTDGGSTWSRLDGHLPTVMWDVEVDPTDDDQVYATSFYDGWEDSVAGIQVSSDAGATWTRPATATPPASGSAPFSSCAATRRDEPSAFGIGIHPGDGTAYVGTNCGVARSDDGGATWTFSDPTVGDPAGNVWDVVVQDDGTTDGIVDVCGDDGVYRSTDGGDTWTDLEGDLPLSVAFGRCSITASPDEDYVVFVNFGRRVFETTDAGATNVAWNEFSITSGGGGRIPFVTTNDRTDGFDLWVGRGVSLARAGCTTPDPLGAGGTQRCPGEGSWVNAQAGAHDDTGDVVFDTANPVDGCPRVYSSDGGVHTNTVASSPDCHNPTWTRSNVGLHALWLYSMAGADQVGVSAEDLYMGAQDTGSFATTDAGAGSPTWTMPNCCDVFNIAATPGQVVWDLFSAYRQFHGGAGMTGQTNVANSAPGAGTQGVDLFTFPDNIAPFGSGQHVVVTGSGPVTTSDITANPVVWNTLGSGAPSNGFCGVQVATSGGTPTFYAQTGCLGVFETGNNRGPFQLWKVEDTDGTWERIDDNFTAGGIEVFGADPNDPDRLYASHLSGPKGVRMISSDDGGDTWEVDDQLTDLMDGGGTFQMQTQRGPTSFTGFQGYNQPSLVAFDPEDSNIIVAGGRESGVFVSTDGGQGWTLVTDPVTPHLSGRPHLPRPFFAYFDHDPADVAVYIGTQGRGVWRISLPDADLSITKADSPDPVAAGTDLTYTLTAANDGPDTASTVTVVDTLPSEVGFESVSAPGWDCTTPDVGASGTVSCTRTNVASGADSTLSITVSVPADTPRATVLSNHARIFSEAVDADLSDNEVTETTDVVLKADLDIVSHEAVDPPPEVLVGEDVDVTIRTTVTNHGPSAPFDARLDQTATAPAGSTVTPTATSDVLAAIGLDEERTIDRTFTVTCGQAGSHAFEFEASVTPDHPDDADPDLSNNDATTTVTVECVVPVQINIQPGGDPNSNTLRNRGVVPVAVLTTEAGEYGLPLDFDATTIIAPSVRFGPASVVFDETGGASPRHDRGHVEDSYELDQQTRDGDLDMVMQFLMRDSELSDTDTEACVKGTFTGAGGATFKFFGCQTIRLV